MTYSKKIALLNTTAPFSHTAAKDSLDVALICGSYEQNTALFFQGDGVWQLLASQQPSLINAKDFLKTFSALTFYDIEHIYVCQTSLRERSLSEDFHIDNAVVLPREEFIHTLNSYQVIFKF